MKKSLVVLAKVLVWLGFISNSGCFHVLKSTFEEDKSTTFNLHGVEIKKQYHSREEEGHFSGRMFLWEEAKAKKIQERLDQGGQYSADQYFSDLREYVDSVQYFGQQTTGLLMNRLSGLDIRSRSQEEIDIARDKYFPEMLAERIERQKHTVSFSETCQRAVYSISKWWLNWYISSLWLALILFIIWIYQENEYTKFRFRNPLSFLIALLLYPFVIGYNVRKWWKNMHGEVEIRRSKDKIFSLLSKDEIDLAKKFANSNLSIKQFRQELKLKGYVPKYSFIAVLFAMLLMTFIPNRIIAKGMNEDQRTTIYQVTNDYDYFHSVDDVAVVSYLPAEVFIQNDEWCKPLIVWIKVVLWRFIVSAPCRGHYRGLDPVPLVVKSNSQEKTFNNQKNIYETNNFSYGYYYGSRKLLWSD